MKNKAGLERLTSGKELDFTRPITEIEILNQQNGEREIILEAADLESGIASTYYSLDGGSYLEYVQPIPFDDSLDRVLQYYSVDRAGNNEHPITYRFYPTLENNF